MLFKWQDVRAKVPYFYNVNWKPFFNMSVDLSFDQLPFFVCFVFVCLIISMEFSGMQLRITTSSFSDYRVDTSEVEDDNFLTPLSPLNKLSWPLISWHLSTSDHMYSYTHVAKSPWNRTEVGIGGESLTPLHELECNSNAIACLFFCSIQYFGTFLKTYLTTGRKVKGRWYFLWNPLISFWLYLSSYSWKVLNRSPLLGHLCHCCTVGVNEVSLLFQAGRWCWTLCPFPLVFANNKPMKL